MTSVLFLARFNNFALTMGFYWSYITPTWRGSTNLVPTVFTSSKGGRRGAFWQRAGVNAPAQMKPCTRQQYNC